MKYSILGATGFIGSRTAELAKRLGHDVFCPARDVMLDGLDLGHAIYAIGTTADFRHRPHETITAHVTKLQEVLQRTSFDSLVYLSSTRVYARCVGSVCDRSERISHSEGAVGEMALIPVLSSDFSDLYNLSKLLGESIALAHGPKVKVARLSNVVGADFRSDNFLISVLRDCVQRGHVELHTSPESAKDYICVEDVAAVLLRLGPEGRSSMYNVASGCQTTNAEIVAELSRLTGASVSVVSGAPTVRFPDIDIRRLTTELGFTPRRIDTTLPRLVDQFRSHSAPISGKDAA